MRLGFVLPTILCLAQCSTLYKDFDEKQLKSNEEFDEVVKIEVIEPPAEFTPQPLPPDRPAPTLKPVAKIKTSKVVSKAPDLALGTPAIESKEPTHQHSASPLAADSPAVLVNEPAVMGPPAEKVPALEDGEGWNGRRPLTDPFTVGEETIWSVTYFGVEAGKFTAQVHPFVQVNGKKCYHFKYLVKTSSLFSMFYSVDDVAETFVDYELWRPLSYAIHVNESKQVRETRTYFDWSQNRGLYWDKKKLPNRPLEEKKMEWDIPEWAQNVFSVAMYLRAHTLRVGKTFKVNVAHEGKNMVMTATVLRKTHLDTKLGRFPAYVVRPSFTLDGVFKPTGDNLLWVSADDRKHILRVESKIRIGTIVAMIESLKK